MMRKILFLQVILVIIICDNTRAQEEKNAFVELGGSGGYASINYEWSAFKETPNNFFYRLGFSFIPIDKNNGTAIIIPGIIKYRMLLQKDSPDLVKKHFAEFGLGQTATITTKGSVFLRMPLVVGYRWQHPDKNWFFRLTYTPIVSYLIDFQYENWVGISIGWKLIKKEEEE